VAAPSEAMNHYLAGRGSDAPVKTLQEIVESGLALGKLQDGLERALKSPPMYANGDYAAFVRNRTAFQKIAASWFEQYDLDAIVYPYQTKLAYTIEQAAPERGAVRPEYNNYDTLGRGTRISTVTGFPGITVPAGVTDSDGMPVSLEFLGLPFSEGPLLGLCYAFEQATHHRKLPDSTPLLGHEYIPREGE